MCCLILDTERPSSQIDARSRAKPLHLKSWSANFLVLNPFEECPNVLLPHLGQGLEGPKAQIHCRDQSNIKWTIFLFWWSNVDLFNIGAIWMFQKVQLTLLLSTWYPWLLRSPLNSVVWKLLTAGCVRGMKRTCSGMAAGWAGWAGRAGAWVGRLTLRGCCWGLLALGLRISDVSICLTTISKLSNYPRIYLFGT